MQRAPALPARRRRVRLCRSCPGRFQIERVLGQGGFGAVYLARDTQLNRQVALKVPRGDTFSTQAELDAFIEEARTAAQLNHPGIVTVYDVGQDGDQVFIVQEYIDGVDLAKYLRSRTLSAAQIVELMNSVADAVAFAHQRGFVHRDLKPANILLDAAAKPRVAVSHCSSVPMDFSGRVDNSR